MALGFAYGNIVYINWSHLSPNITTFLVYMCTFFCVVTCIRYLYTIFNSYHRKTLPGFIEGPTKNRSCKRNVSLR